MEYTLLVASPDIWEGGGLKVEREIERLRFRIENDNRLNLETPITKILLDQDVSGLCHCWRSNYPAALANY